MFSIVEIVVYFGLSILILRNLCKRSRPKTYPPGPTWRLPILGQLPYLLPNPLKTFIELGKKYGPICSLEFGMRPAVFLNDLRLIKMAYNDIDVTGRPDFAIFMAKSHGQPAGILTNYGQSWAEQRRFFTHTLREFGFGKRSIEPIIQDEVKRLIISFGQVVGTPVSTHHSFNAAVVNALWTLIAGERFSPDDPELQVAIRHSTSFVQSFGSMPSHLCNFIPFLPKIAPRLSGFEKCTQGVFPLLEFLRKYIELHKATFLAGQPRDVIDVTLEKIQNTADKDSSFYKENGEKSLLYSMFDLFVGGTETTSITLSWTLLYLAKFPQKQVKLQAEISRVVGDSRLPCLADRPNMPYTEAVVHEVLRFSSLFALDIRTTLKEVELGGYVIPKDTIVMANHYAVHFDPTIWGDPEIFRPERFLNSDETTLVKNEAMIAFSMGKRVCLAESLARDQLFLFTASIFQAFVVSPVTSAEELSIEPVFGAMLMPSEHQLILTARN